MPQNPSHEDLQSRITELEHQIESLRKEAAAYRTLFDSFPHGITISDSDGNIVEANAAAEDLLGISRAEHTKRKLNSEKWDIIRSDGSPFPKNEYPGVIALKENRLCENVEMGIHRPDGLTTWINVTAAPLPSPSREVVITYSDITKRKKAEDALGSAESETLSIIHSMQDGLTELDDEGRHIRVNDSFCKMTGFSREELIGTGLPHIYWPPEEMENIRRAFQKTMDADFVDHELIFMRKNGARFPVILSPFLLKDEKGSGIGHIATIKDVTERKRMEENLHFLGSIAEGISDGVIATNRDMEIIFINKATEQMFGYTLEELKGKTPDLLNAEPHPENIQRKLYETIRRGETFLAEQLNRRKDGSTFWCNFKVSPVEQEDGTVYGYVAVQRDVSQQRQMERQLEQANKIESIGVLAGGIALDFNNILCPIIGLSEFLLEDLQQGTPSHENAQEILQAGKRGSGLVQQILSFSRQSEQTFIPVRLQKILKESLKLIRATIPGNIEILEDIQQDCGLMMASPTQIHQVAMNILTNAYHAVDESRGSISVSLREMILGPDHIPGSPLSPGSYALLTISDTGHGIPPELLTRIFDPYFTTKDQGKGTGLGLATAYGIIKHHRGHIRVTSHPGKGSSFDIFLPLMDKPAPATSLTHSEVLPTGNESILLVDDEGALIKLETLMLQRLGYRITSRVSSIEALEAFRTMHDSIDLVITDMAMPGMTGIELARKIQEINPHIPIIICTGFSEQINPEQATSLGIKGLLMKPVIRSQIAKMVRNVLDEARMTPDSPMEN